MFFLRLYIIELHNNITFTDKPIHTNSVSLTQTNTHTSTHTHLHTNTHIHTLTHC